MTEPSPDSLTAWISLMATSQALLGRIEEALKSAGLPPLTWYDALLEIERAGEDGIRPFALKERLLLPQYSTSRLLERIEKAGLVARAPCEDDGRGQVIRLTDEGRRTRRRMWPVYAGQLVELIEGRLDPAERRRLGELLAKLSGSRP